jgi:hypothetical protein
MDKYTTLTLNKRFIEFEDISKNKTLIREIEERQNQAAQIISEYIVDYTKFRDRKVLSRLSVLQLQNLIKRCEEVIADKISECEVVDEET